LMQIVGEIDRRSHHRIIARINVNHDASAQASSAAVSATTGG